MRAAKRRIQAALILLLVALGGLLAATFMYPGGWLLFVGFGIGALCAWQLVGAFVTYAQAKAQLRLAAAWRKQHTAAEVAKLLRQTTRQAPLTVDQEGTEA